MPGFKNLARNVGRIVSDNSPSILTALGAAGVVSTAVLAIRATMKAEQILRQDAYDNQANVFFWHDIKDRARMTWKLYIPAAITGTVSIVCIFGANSINTKRNAALIGVYTITETAFKEYKDKVVETLGDKADEKLRDSIAKDRIDRDPASDREVVIIGSGQSLCFDSFTGRYFQSDMETLRRAMNDINLQCINEMSASQNDFYNKIGLPPVQTGEVVGWNTDNELELQFTSVLTEEGKPCLAINYRKDPIPKFYKIW